MNLYKFFAACVLMFASVTFADSVSAAPASSTPQGESVSGQNEPAQSFSAKKEHLDSANLSSDSPADIAFSHFYIGVEGGEIYPFGDLVDAVENTLYGGFNIRFSYWENIDEIIMFHYSYFEPRPSKVRVSGVHQFSGKLGIDLRLNFINPVIVGFGFTCDWTRADDDKDIRYTELGGTLTDNETEFGWFARINVPVIKLENYRIGFNVMWEELWTLPKRSDLLSAGLYFERRIW